MSLINRKSTTIQEIQLNIDCIITNHKEIYQSIDKFLENYDLLTTIKFLLKAIDSFSKDCDEKEENFKVSPYTIGSPEYLVELCMARYFRKVLSKQEWTIYFKKPLDYIVPDIRIIKNESTNGQIDEISKEELNEKTNHKNHTSKIVVVDLFAKEWLNILLELYDIKLPNMLSLKLMEVAKLRLEKYVRCGITPKNYFIIFPDSEVLGISSEEFEIQHEYHAKKAGIPKENIIFLERKGKTDELYSFVNKIIT
jgi:hypothetical protein